MLRNTQSFANQNRGHWIFLIEGYRCDKVRPVGSEQHPCLRMSEGVPTRSENHLRFAIRRNCSRAPRPARHPTETLHATYANLVIGNVVDMRNVQKPNAAS